MSDLPGVAAAEAFEAPPRVPVWGEIGITVGLLKERLAGADTVDQRAELAERYVWQTSLHNPSFAEYARICGAHGVRVTEKGALDDAIAEALAHDGPALVEVMADPELI